MDFEEDEKSDSPNDEQEDTHSDCSSSEGESSTETLNSDEDLSGEKRRGSSQNEPQAFDFDPLLHHLRFVLPDPVYSKERKALTKMDVATILTIPSVERERKREVQLRAKETRDDSIREERRQLTDTRGEQADRGSFQSNASEDDGSV